MTLPTRKTKRTKGMGRWKSQKHRDWVRGFHCANCDAEGPIEVAHVRIGSGAGVGQKPDDYRTVPLCKPCHTSQHSMGERSFWDRQRQSYKRFHDDMAAKLGRTIKWAD